METQKIKQAIKEFIFGLLCLLPLTDVKAQWTESEFVSSTSLFKVEFPSENAAYISGDLGSFYKSTDAGETWNSIYDFGPFNSIGDMKFINADTGFVSAYENMRTFDGGFTWNSIGPSAKLTIIQNKLYKSYVSNDTSYIVKSNDFGDSWQTLFINVQVSNQPYRLSFIDTITGYIIHPNELERLYKSTDGGISYDTILGWSGPMQLQEEFVFTDTLNGYLFGSWGSESHPTRTWYQSVITVPIDLDGFGVLPVLDLDFKTDYLYASSLYGKIFYSLNKGQNWFEQTTPVSGPITSISFANDEKGIAVAGDKVLFTNNGGFVGLKEIDLSNFTIYPNPATDHITIENVEKLEINSIVLSDIEGNVIKSFNYGIKELEVKNLPSGVYFVQIVTSQSIWSERIVVE